MADQNPQEHLDSRYDDPQFHLVDEPEGKDEGLLGQDASRFLRLLRPVMRAGQTLREASRSKPS